MAVNLASAGGWIRWLPLGLVGVVAIIGGVTLPGIFPAEPPPAKSDLPLEKNAQKQLQYTPMPWPDPPDTRRMFLKLGLGTIIVLGLCVAALWFGHRWLGQGTVRPAGAGQLRLLETLALGQGCRLHLVQTGTGRVLIGADGTGMKAVLTLAESFDSAFEAGPELTGEYHAPPRLRDEHG